MKEFIEAEIEVINLSDDILMTSGGCGLDGGCGSNSGCGIEGCGDDCQSHSTCTSNCEC